MRRLQVRDAKATFSAVVDAAQRGEPTTITRHGQPAAVVVPIEDAARLYPALDRSFAEHLLAFPGLETERDVTPLRDIAL